MPSESYSTTRSFRDTPKRDIFSANTAPDGKACGYGLDLSLMSSMSKNRAPGMCPMVLNCKNKISKVAENSKQTATSHNKSQTSSRPTRPVVGKCQEQSNRTQSFRLFLSHKALTRYLFRSATQKNKRRTKRNEKNEMIKNIVPTIHVVLKKAKK